ncbi:hypothetical protein CPC08DRAFT_399517 [Agrocybe pediades]|nr:hypothetical protein CPC08DRAFT_399517 [Agrocybe pediades]
MESNRTFKSRIPILLPRKKSLAQSSTAPEEFSSPSNSLTANRKGAAPAPAKRLSGSLPSLDRFAPSSSSPRFSQHVASNVGTSEASSPRKRPLVSRVLQPTASSKARTDANVVKKQRREVSVQPIAAHRPKAAGTNPQNAVLRFVKKGVTSLSPKSSPRLGGGDVRGLAGPVVPAEPQNDETTESVVVEESVKEVVQPSSLEIRHDNHEQQQLVEACVGTPATIPRGDEITGEASPPPLSPRMEEHKGGMSHRSHALAQLEGRHIPPSTPVAPFTLEVPDIAWGPILRKEGRKGWGNRPPDPPDINTKAVIGLEDPAPNGGAASSNLSVMVNPGLPTLVDSVNTVSEMEMDTEMDTEGLVDNKPFENDIYFFGIKIPMTKQVSVVVEENTDGTLTRNRTTSTVERGPRSLRTAHGWNQVLNPAGNLYSDTLRPYSVRVETSDMLSLSMQPIARGPVENLLWTMQADPIPEEETGDEEDTETDAQVGPTLAEEEEWVLVNKLDFEVADTTTDNAILIPGSVSVAGGNNNDIGTRSTATPVIVVEGCTEGFQDVRDFLSTFPLQVTEFGSLPPMDLSIIFKFIRARVLRSRGRKPRSLGNPSVVEIQEFGQQQDRSMTSSDTCSTLVVPSLSSKSLGKKVEIHDAASDNSVTMDEGDTCGTFLDLSHLDTTASPASESTPSAYSQDSFIEPREDAVVPAGLDSTPALDGASGNGLGLGQPGQGAPVPTHAANGPYSRRRSGGLQALQLVDRLRQQTPSQAEASTSQAGSTTPPLPGNSTETFVDDRRLVRHYGVYVDPLTIPRREARRSLSINPPPPLSTATVPPASTATASSRTEAPLQAPAAATGQVAGPSRASFRPSMLSLTAQPAGEDTSAPQESEQSTLVSALSAARRFLGL